MLTRPDSEHYQAQDTPDGPDERRFELAALVDQAARCHRLASATLDREAAEILAAMAADYERAAEALSPR